MRCGGLKRPPRSAHSVIRLATRSSFALKAQFTAPILPHKTSRRYSSLSPSRIKSAQCKTPCDSNSLRFEEVLFGIGSPLQFGVYVTQHHMLCQPVDHLLCSLQMCRRLYLVEPSVGHFQVLGWRTRAGSMSVGQSYSSCAGRSTI